MDNFWTDAKRFWDDYELLQREMETEVRLQEVAERRGMTIDQVKAVIERIREGFKLLHAPERPTQEDLSKFLHAHSRPRE